eukprot:COSAG06_NODE_2651_length_6501_cov_5.374570_8_plen_27_part_01
MAKSRQILIKKHSGEQEPFNSEQLLHA